MGRRRLGLGFVLIWLAWLLPACAPPAPVERLPSAEDTLARVGIRLSRSLSTRELTVLARRGDRVLAALTQAERDVLGRSYLRFRVDHPSVVAVAAPARSFPFWLADQGFRKTPWTIDSALGEWAVFEKSFDAGWIGLGVNGLDRTSPAHYAVFVRSGGGRTVNVAGLDRERWRAVCAGDSDSLADGAPFGPVALPDALRGSTLLRTSHDQRHSTLLARGQVWKTHVPSGPRPDQVAIAFGADAARSLVWTWRTSPDVTASAVRLAPAAPDRSAPRDPREVRVVRGDSQVLSTPDLLNDRAIRRHRVVLTGLEPDTLYAYALGDGSAAGWSPWKTVRTGPARPRRFSLLYLGDAQNGLEGWGKLLESARRRHPDAGVILLAGDLVDRGNERTNWDHFFLRAARVFDEVPLMPCAGNHEYLDQGPRLYRAVFDLPANGPRGIEPDLVYSFEYGDAFIAVLDSTMAVSNPRLAREQAEWLDRVLGTSRARWKLVMFHHPVYASHPSRENLALRAAWVRVFDKHHVDLVLQGHDHAYLRTYPMRAGRQVSQAEQGTVYVVAVSGDKFYDQDPRDYTAIGYTHLATYQTIDVDTIANRLILTAYDADGRDVDRFELQKPHGSGDGAVALGASEE